MATIIFISCVWLVCKLTKAGIKSIPYLFRLAWIIITKPIIELWDLLGIAAARRWNDTDTDTDADTDTERQDISALQAQKQALSDLIAYIKLDALPTAETPQETIRLHSQLANTYSKLAAVESKLNKAQSRV